MVNDILGSKVILRPIKISDTEFIVQWRNTNIVRKNFIFQEDFSREMHLEWMNTKVASGEVVQYVIETKRDCQPIGSVYFRDIDRKNHCAEYGIFIGEEDAQGKGYGTETAKLFLKFGVDKLNLHRIYLRVFPENIRAIKSYQNAGFITEGIAKDMVYQNGIYRDIMFMAYVVGSAYNG